MLHGWLQTKSSAHIRDVCTLSSCRHTSFDVALWINWLFLFIHLLIIADNIPDNRALPSVSSRQRCLYIPATASPEVL